MDKNLPTNSTRTVPAPYTLQKANWHVLFTTMTYFPARPTLMTRDNGGGGYLMDEKQIRFSEPGSTLAKAITYRQKVFFAGRRS